MEKFASITATNHARLCGLKNKGVIMVGMDAEVVLWDSETIRMIRQKDLHHGTDYTSWEGFEIKGWSERTILSGRTVMKDGALKGEPIRSHISHGAPEVLL